MQLNLRSARRARNAFPLVLLAILAGASTAQETDPRDSSSDPWVRGLPDAGELSSTAEPPNLNGTVSEDGTVPTDGDGGSAPGAGGGATGNAGAPSPDDDPRSAGGARPTSPVDVNESEPNGSYGLAQSVPAAARVTGTIEPARDTDSYRVEIRRRGSIEIRFSTVPAGFGPSFRVYDRENAAVTGWIYPPVAGGATEPVVVDLKVAGAYYVAVADDKHDWSGAAPYTLDLRFYEGDRFEPNESYGTATPISANERLTGTILPMGDYDQYAFVVEHAGAIEVTFPHVPKELTPSFRIYDREAAALTGWIEPPLVDGGAETQVRKIVRAILRESVLLPHRQAEVRAHGRGRYHSGQAGTTLGRTNGSRRRRIAARAGTKTGPVAARADGAGRERRVEPPARFSSRRGSCARRAAGTGWRCRACRTPP